MNNLSELPGSETCARGTVDVENVKRANLKAYRYFAAFSKSYKIHKRANKWSITCRRRNLLEETLYSSAVAQGSAYIAAVNQTLDVSDYDRAICRDIARRIEDGDPTRHIVPHIRLGISTISDNAKNAQKELRDIRRDVFELQRSANIPAETHPEAEAEACHNNFADLEKVASSNLLSFTGYFLDVILSAITIFLRWWEERVIWLLAMSMRVGQVALEEHGRGGELATIAADTKSLIEHGSEGILLKGLASLWREAEKGYTAYVGQMKAEQDYLKALMKG
ncbi:hypothetical protein ONZ45_g9684 [Pleurotus djamor]|nr:hypothetical protein ONZ45_g9684 [Pleurotus djamor]